jgi:hypothetical protein
MRYAFGNGHVDLGGMPPLTTSRKKVI